MRALARLEPPPRALDWSLGVAVGLLVATGLASLLVGRPSGGWLLDLHAVAGLTLVGLLGFKLRRVAPRLRPDRLTGPRVLSISLAVVTLAALASGLWWVVGGSISVGPWGLLMVHMALGVAVPLLLAGHLVYRYHSPGRATDRGRRSALSFAALAGLGALTWRGQRAVNDLLDTAGADRRFTGSREDGSGDGNAFPVTSWVADDPDPIDVEAWSLRVDGAVARPGAFESVLSDADAAVRPVEDERSRPADDGPPVDEETAPADDETLLATATESAVLDCTSGWYSDHEWTGVAVADLLAAVDPDDDARWVQFRSVTGYRWSLPIDEARDALLATRVDGEELSHGHGAPMRLVAPGRRGFQWVKWLTEVRVSRRRDPGEWIAIFLSGLDE